MRSYNDLNLPDFSSFRTERVEMPKLVKPRALDTGVIAAINAAAPELSMTDPAVYVAFLMFSRLGLRNIEIRNARWDWMRMDASELPSAEQRISTRRVGRLASYFARCNEGTAAL